MGRWLALARADADEKNANTPACDTPKTPETSPDRVSGVLGVSDPSAFEKFSELADARPRGFGGFGGKPKGAFSEIFSAPLPAPEPITRPPVVEAETPEAAVARRLDAMAAENERRREWHAKPVEGWREGRLVMRSVMTGEEVTIDLRTGRTLH
jgi:hypothetical protein